MINGDSNATTRGHVFVINGDLTAIAADAILIPTDEFFVVESPFADAVGGHGRHRVPGLHWAGQRVVEFTGESTAAHVPRVWLANIGRDDNPQPEWYLEALEEFIEVASVAHEIARRPLLAVNVLGSGKGGSEYDRGSLHDRLAIDLKRHADERNIDLVLVTHGDAPYAAAQRARRALLERTTDGRPRDAFALGNRRPELERAASNLVGRLRQESLVLFLGAGISVAAGLPGWQGLLDELALEARMPNDERARLAKLDARDQAAIIKRRLAKSFNTMNAGVEQRLRSSRYSVLHGLAASMNVRESVTTNFDRLYEAAVEGTARDIAVLPYEGVMANKQWLLKLHGSIDRGDFVLTRRDYLGVPETAGALFGIVQAMLLTRHMLFVGYSLADEDFHAVVEQVRRAVGRQPGAEERDPFGTVLTLFDDSLFDDLWSDDLHVIPMADEPADAAPPTEAQIREASRRLAIFLDLVAFESPIAARYVLDDRYEKMLTDDEERLRDALIALRGASQQDGAESATWASVSRFLDQFRIPNG